MLKKVGYVENVHGTRGTLRVVSSEAGVFSAQKEIYFINSLGQKQRERVFDVKDYRKGRLLLKLVGLKWAQAVEKYHGWDIAVLSA